jgi:CBS domain-containing protein
MNVLFFLRPKEEVVYLCENYTLRQTMEKMERYRYTSVPVLSKDGKYLGTVTEGDILWYIKECKDFNIRSSESIELSTIHRNRDNSPIYIKSSMEDLFSRINQQNFIPVLDDRDYFIGIVTRKDVIEYFLSKIPKEN